MTHSPQGARIRFGGASGGGSFGVLREMLENNKEPDVPAYEDKTILK